jgi:hypothetical protein
MRLTPEEVQTVVHGLRVAADRFEADAETLETVDSLHPGARRSLVDQFHRQAKETRELATKLEGDPGDWVFLPGRA